MVFHSRHETFDAVQECDHAVPGSPPSRPKASQCPNKKDEPRRGLACCQQLEELAKIFTAHGGTSLENAEALKGEVRR